jgi:glycosyltransferase involved in cell wall biosynthesis
MRIVFVLPGRSPKPVGGFKVVYEYANLLAARDHEVSVMHPWSCRPPSSLRTRLEARLWVERLRRQRGSIAPWFEIDRRVALPVVAYPRTADLSEADAIVATAWQTASWVAEATRETGKGFYLIQHYETWDRVEDVTATWRLPLHKIVISRWLEELAIEMGEGSRTSRVPNGLDFDQFGVDLPPEERPPRVGALLSPYKGREEVISALSIARARIPKLGAATFGTGARPPDLPDWVEHICLPSPVALRGLYNSCSVFVQASRTEGWGLPATESMACGCALVTYENGGSREYAIDGRTAMVVSQHAPERLADAIVDLIGNRELRLALSRRGRDRVAAFTWPRAAVAMERVLAGTEADGDARA